MDMEVPTVENRIQRSMEHEMEAEVIGLGIL